MLAKAGRLGLEAQGLAGSMPLRNGDTLQIAPKVGEADFLYMLFRAEGDQADFKREFDDFVAYAKTHGETITSLAARRLAVAAAEVLRRGGLPRRQPKTLRLGHVAGHVDALRTSLLMSRREREPVVTRTKMKSFDTPENRLVAAALRRGSRYLTAGGPQDWREVSRRWETRFGPAGDVGQDLAHVEEVFARGGYGGPRGYYRHTLALAQIVLGASGMTSRSGGDIEADALLVNTADVFERYLRQVVSEHHLPAGYLVTKGGPVARSLYVDGSFELEPDIVVWRHADVNVVADAKYKDPTAGDHYQMQAYLRGFGAPIGFLLAPQLHGTALRTRRYVTTDQKVVVHVMLPMADMSETETFLGSLVEQSSRYL